MAAGKLFRIRQTVKTGAAGSNRGGRTQSESGDQYRNRRPYQTWTTQARQEAADRIRSNMEKTHRTNDAGHAQKESKALVPVKAPGRISGTVMKWVGYSCSGMFGLSLAILGVVGAATGVSLAVPVSILACTVCRFAWGWHRREKTAGACTALPKICERARKQDVLHGRGIGRFCR